MSCSGFLYHFWCWWILNFAQILYCTTWDLVCLISKNIQIGKKIKTWTNQLHNFSWLVSWKNTFNCNSHSLFDPLWYCYLYYFCWSSNIHDPYDLFYMSYFPPSPYTQFLQTTKADPGGVNKKLQRWQEIISPPGVAGRFGTAVSFWEGWGNNCLAFKSQQKT